MESKKKWVGITLAAVLLLGIGVGVLVDRFLLLATVESATNVDSGSEGNHEDHAKRFRARLQQELDLTGGQTAQLDQVLEKNHETAARFWQDSRTRFDELRMSFREDIRSLLNPEQRVKFDEMLAKHDKERQERSQESSKTQQDKSREGGDAR
jgi:Spy/CpxP family protein refolding chaperone